MWTTLKNKAAWGARRRRCGGGRLGGVIKIQEEEEEVVEEEEEVGLSFQMEERKEERLWLMFSWIQKTRDG